MNEKIQKIITISLLVLFITTNLTNVVSAVSDQFEINLTVTGADTTAPSVPTGLSATAVSTSQINLSWTASTDNVAVSGYYIYRDNNLVTSTTGTSYSDTGLTANTTYAYAVSAYDSSSNESARSSTSTATTFSNQTGGGGTGGGSSSSNLPQIYNLNVVPSLNSAVINWETSKDTLAYVYWGETANYEIGSSANGFYLMKHSTLINGLNPGTNYFFLIKVVDGSGKENFYKGSFTTNQIGEIVPNPTSFTATPNQKNIDLSWNNPSNSQFDSIKIVRNDQFYPADPQDGEIIYQGNDESFTDTYVEENKRYYYAIFAEKNGKYSSGAVTTAKIVVPGQPEEKPIDVVTDIPKSPLTHPLIDVLTLKDFEFIQNGKKLVVTNSDQVDIDGSKNLTISLPYSKVPEILKTILVTLVSPNDQNKVFSFILKVNEEKTAYVATIGALEVSGKYQVLINVVDYKNRGLKKIEGLLVAAAQSVIPKNNQFTDPFNFLLRNFWNILLLLILLALVAYYLKKRTDKNKKVKEGWVVSREIQNVTNA